MVYKGRYRPCESCDFTKSKIGKYGKEIGEITKSGKIGTFT